jgi:hypothetical protein
MVKRFRTLSDAVDFISRCLEEDASAELASAPARFAANVARDPDYLDYFSRFIFEPLQETHRRTDLRALYAGREFPSQETHFKLGGHMAELGCIHVDFVRQGAVWTLEEIWLCR